MIRRFGIIAAGALGFALAAVSAHAEQHSFDQVETGRYLATAGDCISCHTVEGGKPFAGNRPIQTPFGVIYSPNITPDRDTGIGTWSAEDFRRALHRGISPDGEHLYPAFPYPWFTKVKPQDVEAIRAYLSTVNPVKSEPRRNDLTWPLGNRFLMAGWNELYFTPGVFEPDPQKPAEWNRGAYLVEGLGHCGACHSPTNTLGATEKDHRFQGGSLQNWYAPGLTGDLRTGLGAWTEADVTIYLKTGRNAHSTATGPMSEVIQNSTSKLRDDDLKAIAVYLKSLPTTRGGSPERPGQAVLASGEAIYVDSCSACHHMAGEGVPSFFPPLKGSQVAQSPDPTTMLRLILEGARSAVTDQRPTPLTMPAFGWKLSDSQIAAVASYVRNAWGNAASPVSASDVKSLRNELRNASTESTR